VHMNKQSKSLLGEIVVTFSPNSAEGEI
jgi:hypothetical protein